MAIKHKKGPGDVMNKSFMQISLLFTIFSYKMLMTAPYARPIITVSHSFNTHKVKYNDKRNSTAQLHKV